MGTAASLAFKVMGKPVKQGGRTVIHTAVVDKKMRVLYLNECKPKAKPTFFAIATERHVPKS